MRPQNNYQLLRLPGGPFEKELFCVPLQTCGIRLSMARAQDPLKRLPK